MDTKIIWWSGVALDVAILSRGCWTGLLRKFPLFYTYIGCVVVKEIIGLLSYEWAPRFYEPLYWPAELATVLASYAVIIEIFRQDGGKFGGPIQRFIEPRCPFIR